MFEPLPLPIDEIRDDFMGSNPPIVITAPTASGKSTRVPLWCAARGSRTLVIEPRRTACRALCRYVQSEFESHGIRAGYMVRHEQSSAEKADVLYVTPGVALRMLETFPPGVSNDNTNHATAIHDFETVIIDEFHERPMENDLLLAVLKTAAESASNARQPAVVVMSATIDVKRVSQWLGAKVITSEGRGHEVSIHHLEERNIPDIPTSRGLEERVLAGVEKALTAVEEGDILVFLPGKSEIEKCRRFLSCSLAIPTLKLHGTLPPEEQDLAFQPAAERRAILSTNVAESSVTLPGVRAVVDSGLERRTTYRHTRSVLSLMAISRESAEQRAGRAGRLGPGAAIRLWSRKGVLRSSTPPEILREDLDSLVLKASALGRSFESLNFPDPPDPAACKAAAKRLVDMNLLDEKSCLTETGQSAVRLPVDPIYSVLLVTAQKGEPGDRGFLVDMVNLVASLSAQATFFKHGPYTEFEGAISNRRRSQRSGTQEIRKTGPLKGFSLEESTLLRSIKCDATARILAMRGHPLLERLARKTTLNEARRIKKQLLSLLGLNETVERSEKTLESLDQSRLLKTTLTALPHCAYIRKGAKFAAPSMEVGLSSDSFVAPDTPAIAILDMHSARSRGFKVTHTATCCIPLSMRDLAALGLGERILVAISRKDSSSNRNKRTDRRNSIRLQSLMGLWSYTYAGREIYSEEKPLTHEDTLEAATLLIQQGKVLDGAYDLIVENIHQTNLFLRSRSQSTPSLPDPDKWLKTHLKEIGLQKIEDLDLLCPQDLIPNLADPAEMKIFKENHPLSLNLIDRTIRVEYDFDKREIVLFHKSGRQSPPPSVTQLPKWPGWNITYQVHSRKWSIKKQH